MANFCKKLTLLVLLLAVGLQGGLFSTGSKKRPLENTAAAAAAPEPVKFVCDYPGCNTTCTEDRYLRQHKKKVHNDTLLHTCNKCGFTTDKSSGLTKHLGVHTRSFICTYCKKAFSQKGGLKRHTKRIHPGAAIDEAEADPAVMPAETGDADNSLAVDQLDNINLDKLEEIDAKEPLDNIDPSNVFIDED